MLLEFCGHAVCGRLAGQHAVETGLGPVLQIALDLAPGRREAGAAVQVDDAPQVPGCFGRWGRKVPTGPLILRSCCPMAVSSVARFRPPDLRERVWQSVHLTTILLPPPNPVVTEHTTGHPLVTHSLDCHVTQVLRLARAESFAQGQMPFPSDRRIRTRATDPRCGTDPADPF